MQTRGSMLWMHTARKGPAILFREPSWQVQSWQAEQHAAATHGVNGTTTCGLGRDLLCSHALSRVGTGPQLPNISTVALCCL